MNKGQLINMINDTLDKCENDYQWMVDNAKNNYYSAEHFKIETKIKKFSKANIKLVKKTTVETIIENKNKVFAVLNFASAKTPGGGVLRGAFAQEEALARVSSLLPLIDQCVEFYTSTSAPHYSDKIIYSTPIYIFKNEHGVYIDPIECDIITCAAPNYNSGRFDYKHMRIMTTRFTKVLKSAIANGQRNLILGAWGCGVFRNPPSVNAQIFRKVLDDYSDSFDEIIFAIPDDSNYKVFKDYLFDKTDLENAIDTYNV